MSAMYSAHVQHTLGGSGYMMGGSRFGPGKEQAIEQAVANYLRLVAGDNNPFGRNMLQRGGHLAVTLIPGELRGPDMMAYIGECSIWNEDGSDAYETDRPEPILVAIQ